MPVLRQNFFTKEWVIIATERAKRPEAGATKCVATSPELRASYGRRVSWLRNGISVRGPNFFFSAYRRQRRKTMRRLAITGMER